MADEKFMVEEGICDICLRDPVPTIFPVVGYCPHICKDCLLKLVERFE